ncbi:MAG: hypothetical protein ACF787_11935, partial [Rhodopirellula sp. JB053]
MSEFLLYYRRPDPTTWVYMSSFFTIGLFFVFRRFWSIRNLDILLLILLAPGLLMVNEGYRRQTRLDRELVQTLAQQRSAGGSQSIEDSTSSQEKTKPEASGSDQAAPVQTSVRDREPFPNDVSEPAGGAEPFRDAGFLGDADASNETDGQTLVSQTQNVTVTPDEGPAPDATLAPETIQPAEVADADPRTPEQIAAYDSATSMRRHGFIWLFVIEMGLMIRMLLDPLMVRRPLLDPNLTTGGLNFLGISLFIFMMANVVASTPEIQREQGPELGPGYALMNMLPTIPVRPISEVIGGAEPPTLDELSPAQ